MQQRTSPEKVVLLIDGDPKEHLFVSQALQLAAKEIKLLAKSSVEEVIDYFSQGFVAPRFVLLDVEIKGACGFNVLRTLKANAQTRCLNVYMISSNDEEKDRKMAMDLGATGYFAKPRSMADYFPILTALLDQSQGL